MLTRTKDLTGDQLDWAVATCEGWELKTVITTWYGNEPWFELFLGDKPWVKGTTFRSVRRKASWELAYSVNWPLGGEIIGREQVMFEARPGGQVFAYLARSGTAGVSATGPTHLIAAMRCFVASKLGAEVDVPQELLP